MMKHAKSIMAGALIWMLLTLAACKGQVNKQPAQLKPAAAASPKLIKQQLATATHFRDISGVYIEADDHKADSSTDGCNIVARITKADSGYRYKLVTPSHQYKGQIMLSHHPDHSTGIMFLGIKYAEDQSDLNEDSATSKNNLPDEPPSVGGELRGDTIAIQNSGNSMNYYVQLGDCQLKFIYLVRRPKITTK